MTPAEGAGMGGTVGHCRMCHGRGRTLLARVSDPSRGADGSWAYVQCRTCRMLWIEPNPTRAGLRAAYERYHTHLLPQERYQRGTAADARAGFRRGVFEAWYGYRFPSERSVAGRVGRIAGRSGLFRERLGSTILWLHARSRGRLLDVGCGGGEFLRRMKGLGWVVFGVEPDPIAARAAADAAGAPIHRGYVTDVSAPEGPFDVVSLNHVIEHVREPLETLRAAARRLHEQGRLVLSTPNARSLLFAHFGEHWRGLEAPRHLHVFTPFALRRLARAAGLRVLRLRTTSVNARWYARQSLESRHRARGGTPSPALDALAAHAAGFAAGAGVGLPEHGEEIHMICGLARD